MGKNIKTYKSDTSINWAKAKNFRPKPGELIFYSDTLQIKIGEQDSNEEFGIGKLLSELDFLIKEKDYSYEEESESLIIN